VLDILHCKLTFISNVPNSKEFLAGVTDKTILDAFDDVVTKYLPPGYSYKKFTVVAKP
jgi:hypothetical protein